MPKLLSFEKPIEALQQKISDLKKLSEEGDVDLSKEIAIMEKRMEKLKKEIFQNLTPSQILQIARHPDRPNMRGLCSLLFDSFIELHGDRLFRDDPSIVAGLAEKGPYRFVVIGHQKGHDTKSNILYNFGMPYPEGYRKALRLMKMGEKFGCPIITFIDTPGAYPGIGAEERGQAEAIARNLREMAALKVPIITFVIGEGGSGGALAIGLSNKVYMLENSVYSVITPEGCASILFRDATKASFMAKNLKVTAADIKKLGVADGVISEPVGGAHKNWSATAEAINTIIDRELKSYQGKSATFILEERFQKFRKLGQFNGTNVTI